MFTLIYADSLDGRVLDARVVGGVQESARRRPTEKICVNLCGISGNLRQKDAARPRPID